MKKIFITLTFVFLLLTLLVGCESKNKPTVDPENSILIETIPSIESSETVPPPPLMVADAAMYRGTIDSIEKIDIGINAVLSQYAGVDYGSPSINITIPADSRSETPLSDLKVGDYLEVYYGGSLEAGIDESLQIILYNYLGDDAASRNFNGEIITINSEDGKTGSFLMKDLSNDSEMAVNFVNDGNTQFYLDFSALAVGDKLNIYHTPMMTASMPPQIFALEVRPYAE